MFLYLAKVNVTGRKEVKVQRLFLLQFVFGLFQFGAVDCCVFLKSDDCGRCVWFGFGKLGELFCCWYRAVSFTLPRVRPAFLPSPLAEAILNITTLQSHRFHASEPPRVFQS